MPAPALPPGLIDAWHEVLDEAVAYRELCPWDSIAPDAVLGVVDAVTGETDWCTVMGHGEELFGTAIYPGDAGYASLRGLESIDQLDAPVAQRAVTVTFESAATLMPRCKRLLKQVGRSFRGAHAWPEVLVHEPGLVPVPPSSLPQLHRIANALRGLAALVPVCADDHTGGACAHPDRAWVIEPPFEVEQRRQRQLPPAEQAPAAPPPCNQLEVARLRAASKALHEPWFVDWFPGPIVDGPEARGRPFYTTHLMVVHPESGAILGVDVGRLEGVPADLQALVLDCAGRLGVPAGILVRRQELAVALAPMAAALGVPLRMEPRLVGVTHAVHDSFMQFMVR